MILRPPYKLARFPAKLWRILMHMKYGNSMCSKRKRDDMEVWTPATDPKALFRKRDTFFVRNAPSKENKRPRQNSACAKVHAVTRRHYTYTEKAKFLAIFQETKETFAWMSQKDLLKKFHVSNPALPLNTMMNFLGDSENILARAHPSSPPEIRNSCVTPGRLAKYKVGQFELAEIELCREITDRHVNGLMISAEWIMSSMRKKIENLEGSHRCTRGWLYGLMTRFELSFRKASNVHSETVFERKVLLETFYKYIKDLCRPPPDSEAATKYGRFPLSRRIHGDQVPLEFQGTLNRSIAPKGSKRVQVKQPKINLDFRVATLMLYFVADAGEPWLRPAIVFRLIPFEDEHGNKYHHIPKSAILREEFVELHRDFSGIDIYVQKKGYMDNSVCIQAANDLVDSFSDPGEYLVCLDNHKGHTSDEFKDILKREGNAFVLYTPPNCTDLCAVTDAGLGRTIKNLMRCQFKANFDANLSKWIDGQISPKS